MAVNLLKLNLSWPFCGWPVAWSLVYMMQLHVSSVAILHVLVVAVTTRLFSVDLICFPEQNAMKAVSFVDYSNFKYISYDIRLYVFLCPFL